MLLGQVLFAGDVLGEVQGKWAAESNRGALAWNHLDFQFVSTHFVPSAPEPMRSFERACGTLTLTGPLHTLLWPPGCSP